MWYRTDVNSNFHLCIAQDFNTAHPILLPSGVLHWFCTGITTPCYICLATRGHLSGNEPKQAAFETREEQSKSLKQCAFKRCKEIYYGDIFFPSNAISSHTGLCRK